MLKYHAWDGQVLDVTNGELWLTAGLFCLDQGLGEHNIGEDDAEDEAMATGLLEDAGYEAFYVVEEFDNLIRTSLCGYKDGVSLWIRISLQQDWEKTLAPLFASAA